MHPKWEEANYMRRIALTLIVAALLVALSAAPALAFHHVFVPADQCGESINAGGNNPTASTAISENNPAQTAPLPPNGTAAVGASDVIGKNAPCPAPDK